jgi:hypothetical protein
MVKKVNMSSKPLGNKTEVKEAKNDPTKTLLGNFNGTMTLYTLQDKIKRQPELYRNEFKAHLELFQQKLADFKEQPAKKDDRLDEYFKFMAHISGVYKEDLADYLSNEYINLLQQYYSIMNPVMR